MVVADLAAVKDGCRTYRTRAESLASVTELVCHGSNQRRQHFPHVIRQVPAVGPGIGDQFLLIKALGVVQGLLRCEAKNTVCITLQAGQVIEKGRFLQLFFGFDDPDHGFTFLPAESSEAFSLILFLKAGTRCRDPTCRNLHGPEGLRLESRNLGIPHHHHGKGRRHNTAYCQGLAIKA